MDKSAHAEPITSHWKKRLRSRLAEHERKSLRRALRACPDHLTDLASNDYLNLRRHHALAKAASEAALTQATGAGASRLIAGDSDFHQKFEARFAAFKGDESALCLPSGFSASLALLGALVQPGDLILADKLIHASLIDAARLAIAQNPGAQFRTFAHLNTDRARALALKHLQKSPESNIWLLTDSIFSMDGDIADLPALATLRDDINRQHAPASCCLIVDEAHATGILGETGAGLDELHNHVADVSLSTLSKALGASGGVISGPVEVTNAVLNFGRAFIYTTGVAPPTIAAAAAALDLLRADAWRRDRLAMITRDVRHTLASAGWLDAQQANSPTPIIPLITGSAQSAQALAKTLEEAGFFAPAIRTPTVAPGAERVRIALSCEITDEQCDHLTRTIINQRDLLKP